MKRLALCGLFAALVFGLAATADAQLFGRFRGKPNTCDQYGCYDANGNLIPKQGFVNPAPVPPGPAPQQMPGAMTVRAENPVKVSASLRSNLFAEFVKLKVAAELRKKGKTAAEAHALAFGLSNEMVLAMAETVKAPVSVIGDGTILNAILQFFQSPVGQQVLQQLIEALLKLLGV